MVKDKEEKENPPVGGKAKKLVVVEEVPATEKEEPSSAKAMEGKKGTNLFWIIIPTAFLVGGLVGGLITYFSGMSKLSQKALTPAPTFVPSQSLTPSPSATPSSEIKRSDLKIQVLNGSGVSGAAGKAMEYLESVGYKDVAVGNAKTSDFSQTEIAIKKEKESYLKILSDDLSEKYQISSKSATLDKASKYDAVVTLGKK